MFGRRPTSSSVAVETAPPEPVEEDLPPSDIVQLFTPKKERVRKSVEQLLLERGHVTEEQLAQAKQVQSQTPGKQLPQILLTMNAASEAQVLDAQAECLGLAFEIPDRSEVGISAFNLLPSDY